MAKTPNIDLRDSLVGNNLIINGDMSIAQRGTSFAAIASLSYSLDRWIYIKSGAMVHTISQDTDVPTFAESGQYFANSLRMNLTTPDDSIAASDVALITQYIEGYNFRKIAGKPFTLSFWVKSTTTGIRCVNFRNQGDDRSYVAEYTINAANTWEKKTITVAANPSAGTWLYNNGVGLKVSFSLAIGTTYHAAKDAWQIGAYLATSNQVNGTATGSTDFRITGVMLNEGSEALPFSLAGGSYGSELALCQRYYEVIEIPSTSYTGRYGLLGGVGEFRGIPIHFKEKRATPTPIYYSAAVSGRYWVDPGIAPYSGDTANAGIFAINKNTVFWTHTRVAGGSAPTQGSVYIWEPAFSIILNAEL